MRLGRAGVVIVESVKSVRLPVLVLAILAAWVLIHGILRDGGWKRRLRVDEASGRRGPSMLRPGRAPCNPTIRRWQAQELTGWRIAWP